MAPTSAPHTPHPAHITLPPSTPQLTHLAMPTKPPSKANPIGLDLRLRPIGPNHRAGEGHSCPFVSWNVRGTCAPCDYLHTAIATNADMFVTQEPYCPDVTDSHTNWLQQEALRRGFDLYVSTNTFVYIRIDHLGRRVIKNSCIDDGRAQIFLLSSGPCTLTQDPQSAPTSTDKNGCHRPANSPWDCVAHVLGGMGGVWASGHGGITGCIFLPQVIDLGY